MDKNRVISAAVLIPVVILFIYFAPSQLWLALVLAIGIIALGEYHNMVPQISSADKLFSQILVGVAIILAFYTENIAFVGFITFFLLTVYHIRKKEDHNALVRYFLRDLLGIIYCTLLPSYILLIRIMDGRSYIYLLLITIWSIDTAAYYVGSAIGKHKLIENISPKKTIEGSIGGTFGAVIVCVTAKIFYFTNFSLVEAVMLGIVLSVSAQFGDLFESLLKRAGGIKDSGNLIPGHGGILDRIDSMLFAAPAFYYFTLFLHL